MSRCSNKDASRITISSFCVYAKFKGNVPKPYRDTTPHDGGFYKLESLCDGRSSFGLLRDIRIILDLWKPYGISEYRIIKTTQSIEESLVEHIILEKENG